MSPSPVGIFRAEVLESGHLVRLSGIIDEKADLSFFSGFHGHVRLDVKGVRRINSYGVRAWNEAIRTVPADATFEFLECAPPIVDQLNSITGFQGRGRVASFYAPMACEKCGTSADHLFQVSDCRAASGHLPKVACPRCQEALELDDIEERYLHFIRQA